MVDSWRAAIGAQPHLLEWFTGPDGYDGTTDLAPTSSL